MVRVASVKMPRLLTFARHVEARTIEVWKSRNLTLNWKSDTALYYRYFEEFGEGTLLAMSKTINEPNTSSLKTGSGATERVLD